MRYKFLDLIKELMTKCKFTAADRAKIVILKNCTNDIFLIHIFIGVAYEHSVPGIIIAFHRDYLYLLQKY